MTGHNAIDRHGVHYTLEYVLSLLTTAKPLSWKAVTRKVGRNLTLEFLKLPLNIWIRLPAKSSFWLLREVLRCHRNREMPVGRVRQVAAIPV